MPVRKKKSAGKSAAAKRAPARKSAARKRASAGKSGSGRKRARILVRQLHNIEIRDTDANWLIWGNLVLTWIFAPAGTPLPDTKKKLSDAMLAAGLTANDFHIKGDDTRRVDISFYPNAGPIVIPIPTENMVKKDRDELLALSRMPVGQKHYPTPDFYRRIFAGNPAKKDLTYNQMLDIAARRLGEYVINECM